MHSICLTIVTASCLSTPKPGKSELISFNSSTFVLVFWNTVSHPFRPTRCSQNHFVWMKGPSFCACVFWYPYQPVPCKDPCLFCHPRLVPRLVVADQRCYLWPLLPHHTMIWTISWLPMLVLGTRQRPQCKPDFTRSQLAPFPLQPCLTNPIRLS